MKERPILFSGPMVRAILDGRKTQTRRVMSPQPVPCDHTPPYSNPRPPMRFVRDVDGTFHCPTCGNGVHFVAGPKGAEGIRCPYGVPGDRLWARETFLLEDNREYFGDAEFAPPLDGRPIHHHDPVNEYDREHDLIPRYRATEPDFALECEHEDCNHALGPCMHPWRPSIFMPRWASRITLELTDVRVQRVQEISEEDAIAEGLEPIPNSEGPYFFSYRRSDGGWHNAPTAKECFADLWDSINGKTHPWANNDWVWAVSFRRLP